MPGGARSYPLDEIAQWLRRDGPWRQGRVRLVDSDDDEPGDSVELELLRRENRIIASLKRREMEKSLVPRRQVHEGLARCASILRRVHEQMQKSGHDDAADLLDAGLDEFVREIEAMQFDDDDDDDLPR